MIKEFIVKMRDDNEQKINSLESEMSELVRDLSCAEQLLEKMLREKKSDTYIFSPRAMDFQIDEKIRTKQSEIRELKQKIEYVRHMMEERLKNREEYNKLLTELEAHGTEYAEQTAIIADSGESGSIATATAAESTETSVYDSNIEIQMNPGLKTGTDLDLTAQDRTDSETLQDNSKNPNPSNSSNMESSEMVNSSESNFETEEQNSDLIKLNKSQLLSFLQTIYASSEACLALMNGNKNRCMNEIRKLMKSISDFKKVIEIDDV
ncbi:MAG: hypothetical protein LUI87_04700 [Lachnospiraceae bacterium]|nr:hypothetical protein [Lachnospiraceae bacterium]